MRKLVKETRSVWLTKTKVTKENAKTFSKGRVLYWMWRDQRAEDNWALLRAQELAEQCGSRVSVLFLAVPEYIQYSARHYGFILKGLKEVEESLTNKHISFEVAVSSDPVKTILKKMKNEKNCILVSDFTPLRENKQWTKDIREGLDALSLPFCQVDAHNIVPYNITSNKCEYAARTIRRKIMDRLDEYMDEFPPLNKQEIATDKIGKPFDYDTVWKQLVDAGMDTSVKEVDAGYFTPGYKAGMENLLEFCSSKFRLERFGSHRNDPNHPRALSRMSPYFHFGHVSVQRAMMEAKKAYKARGNPAFKKGLDAFIEEGVVRRELSDNFCFYNEKYDSLKGAYGWAQETLREHKLDKREYIYSFDEFAKGKTHDGLWNAAQLQLVNEGKMHGFMRMYWAKKILEWSEKPKIALKTAQKLNDKYALDGNDPNGFVGVGWSIMGIHDQGWREREIFGKIRYMNFAGCKRKFDVQKFIDTSKAKYGTDGKKTLKRMFENQSGKVDKFARVRNENSKFKRIKST
eukprot:CAMPEP_0204824222 /NCGR_PEP_ID=MMETSP1346-20131115/2255_1 /ASSEMBLY_ACC=CAM_ASM_000771 /TAXON_ID=215587 /ORGANISM="Aplanochytrium stocchinoi, Strain GSBS06" /LENGTH=517 /DNA_ID=CAMNT_0051951249 /DNA_START=83 /DNA_END=1636 /DNA_ORIENTATION=+